MNENSSVPVTEQLRPMLGRRVFEGNCAGCVCRVASQEVDARAHLDLCHVFAKSIVLLFRLSQLDSADRLVSPAVCLLLRRTLAAPGS